MEQLSSPPHQIRDFGIIVLAPAKDNLHCIVGTSSAIIYDDGDGYGLRLVFGNFAMDLAIYSFNDNNILFMNPLVLIYDKALSGLSNRTQQDTWAIDWMS